MIKDYKKRRRAFWLEIKEYLTFENIMGYGGLFIISILLSVDFFVALTN